MFTNRNQPQTSTHVRFRRLGLLGFLAVLTLVFAVACGGQPQTGSQQPAGGGGGSDSGQAPAPPAPAPKPAVKEPIVFAGGDWDSIMAHNAVARYIIEKGYGHQTDEIPGSTIPLAQGMLRGDIHVTMEIWYDSAKEAYDKGFDSGAYVDLGVNFPDSVQGWYVPTYVIKGDPARGIQPMAPDLKSVADLPKYWELFKDPEEPTKGRFYNCIAGWQCEMINGRKLEAYGLLDYFVDFRPGTGTALATSLTAAYKKGDPWFGYYWGPTSILGKHDMTLLEEPPYSKECWDTTQACAYPNVPVTIAVYKEFAEQAPHLVEFLQNYETTEGMVSQMLAAMEDGGGEPEAAAIWFLQNQEAVWTQWVPADVADKVKAALAKE